MRKKEINHQHELLGDDSESELQLLFKKQATIIIDIIYKE